MYSSFSFATNVFCFNVKDILISPQAISVWKTAVVNWINIAHHKSRQIGQGGSPWRKNIWCITLNYIIAKRLDFILGLNIELYEHWWTFWSYLTIPHLRQNDLHIPLSMHYRELCIVFISNLRQNDLHIPLSMRYHHRGLFPRGRTLPA